MAQKFYGKLNLFFKIGYCKVNNIQFLLKKEILQLQYKQKRLRQTP